MGINASKVQIESAYIHADRIGGGGEYESGLVSSECYEKRGMEDGLGGVHPPNEWIYISFIIGNLT